MLLASISFFFLAVAAASLIGIYQIGASTSVIVDRETPFVRSIEEALFSMIQAQFATERLLDLDSSSQTDESVQLKQTLDTANERFRMFMAAITWGSESDAFRQADGGSHVRAWQENGYRGTLVVQESSPVQAQHAGRVNIYYGGYVNNVQKAIEERERYISLEPKNAAEAEAARIASKEFQIKARHLADLTAENLREMIALSNETAAGSAETLRATEDSVRGSTLIVSVIGLLVTVAIGLSFAEKIIVEPVLSLAKVAQAFGAGKLTERVRIETRDEMAILGKAFNEMADRLAAHTTELESEVSKRTQELKQNFDKLQLANDRLRELDKAKSEFISVAAHQLRTPLSAIKWILGLLIEENAANLTAEQKSLLYKGFESNERMIALINEMLVVTRIESGKVEYKFAPTHIEDLIDNILLDFSAQAHIRSIKLSFERPSVGLPYIKADPDKIRQVLQNLIENAMHYTDDKATITLNALEKGSMIEVAVRDNGIGIPVAQQSSIFNKFFRADNAVKHQTDGSGLGLFIAKATVEKHGGTIWFESAEGKGTTFFFTVPVSAGDA